MPSGKACLGYPQAYDEQNTKAFQFQNFSLKETSALVLEGLRDLTVLRAASVSKPPATEVSYEERIYKLEKYLTLLHNFVDKSHKLMDSQARHQLSFDWISPQASSPNFHSLHGVELELAMVLMLTAAALRQQADALSLETCNAPVEQPEAFAAAVRLFQKAAGMLMYVDAKLLPAEGLATGGKLQQALPQLVRAMTNVCLGEAQAMVASRAEVRGSPPNLIAALHLGASELFEAAAKELRPNPGGVASQRFRMFLALSSELHQARARISIAAHQSKEGHPGAACADLLEARRRLNDAKAAAEVDFRWRDMFAAESQTVLQKMQLYEQERQVEAALPHTPGFLAETLEANCRRLIVCKFLGICRENTDRSGQILVQVVSIERIATHCSQAPSAKILSKAIEYFPSRLTVEIF